MSILQRRLRAAALAGVSLLALAGGTALAGSDRPSAAELARRLREFDVAFGDGIGRYLIDGGGNDAFVDARGHLDTIQA